MVLSAGVVGKPQCSSIAVAAYERLQDPITAEDVTIAVFDDTCGSLIQLVQQ